MHMMANQRENNGPLGEGFIPKYEAKVDGDDINHHQNLNNNQNKMSPEEGEYGDGDGDGDGDDEEEEEESFISPMIPQPFEYGKQSVSSSSKRRGSKGSKSRRSSNTTDNIRRSSTTNSLQVPKRQQHQHNKQTPIQQHRHQSQHTQQGPLQRRKWSKYLNNETFDFDPLNDLSSNLSRNFSTRSSISSSKSGSSTANDQEIGNKPVQKNQSSNGLLGTNEENHDDHDDDDDDDQEKEQIKEVGQLASVFLEIRKNIMTDCNIDLSHNENLDLERDKNIPGTIRLKNISRSTIQRAEKVKMMLNLYYYYIFNSQRLTTSKYKGVDGVYNPLQVIRNRRIRKKYHQPPKLAIKTLPYASTVFSKSKHKLLWQVDLTELTYDFNWRAQHWHELVNPMGELWFPYDDQYEDGKTHHHNHHHHNQGHGHGHHHHHNHHHRPHLHHRHSSEKNIPRIHDQIFETDQNINDNDDDLYIGGSNHSNDSKDDVSLENRSRKRDIITSKIRRRSKSPYKRKNQFNSKEQLNDGFEFDKKAKSSLDLSFSAGKLVPTESHNDSFKGNLLNDISIEPIKNQRFTSTSTGDSNGQLNGNGIIGATTTTSSISNNSEDLEIEEMRILNVYLNKLKRLDDLMNFGEHHLTVKEREYSYLINFQKILKKSDEIRLNSKYLKESIFPKYEHLLIDKSKHLEFYQNELTNNYSPRVDKLLLLSDRTIGEVNTTLSLEVRKLSERLEKLGPSYKRTGALVNLAYWLLENSIVLLLWTIWIGFSIGRIIKFFFMLIWKVLKWIFA